MKYNFDIILKPYGDSPAMGIVGIDKKECYGYWERRDGTEGGGLWFINDHGTLELIDYDGAFELPSLVVETLRQSGVNVSELFG